MSRRPFIYLFYFFLCVCIEKLVGKGQSDLCSISKLSGIILKTIVHALTHTWRNWLTYTQI